MEVSTPDSKLLHEIDLSIRTEELLEKAEKESLLAEDEKMVEFNVMLYETKRAVELSEEMKERDKESVKALKNVYSKTMTFAEEMINSSELEKPSISFFSVERVMKVDSVLVYYFFDNRYMNEGEFYIPYLSSCDWSSDDDEVKLDIYDVLRFNIKKHLKKGFGLRASGSAKIYTSSIWENDPRALKLLNRMKLKVESEKKRYRYEKYLELKNEFEGE